LAPQAANRYLSTGFFFHVITDLRTFQTLMLRGFNCTLLLYRRKRHGFLRSSERRIQSRREHLLNMRPCRQIATDNGFSPRAVLFPQRLNQTTTASRKLAAQPTSAKEQGTGCTVHDVHLALPDGRGKLLFSVELRLLPVVMRTADFCLTTWTGLELLCISVTKAQKRCYQHVIAGGQRKDFSKLTPNHAVSTWLSSTTGDYQQPREHRQNPRKS
jgi:hypothetical protein